MPDVLIDHETALDVLVEREVDVVVEQSEPAETIVTEGLQGPPGRDGNAAGGALMAANRLSEFASDPTAQLDAQENIGLGAVDPLAYYILAKA